MVHDSLYMVCMNEKTKLVQLIREANIIKSKRQVAEKKVFAKNAPRSGRGEMKIEMRNHRHEITASNQRPEIFSRAERERMQQKIKSSTPMTTWEIKVLTREITIRSAASEEKEEMANAVSKIYTKLHLLYTMGIRNVPEQYHFNWRNLNSNLNNIYKANDAINTH